MTALDAVGLIARSALAVLALGPVGQAPPPRPWLADVREPTGPPVPPKRRRRDGP